MTDVSWVAGPGESVLAGCRRTAREEGLAPALAVLCAHALPEFLPCGSLGHAVVPTELAVAADRVWLAGTVFTRSAGTETTLGRGAVVVLRHVPGGDGSQADSGEQWRTGLVWLRLGLSERLLDDCLAYLGNRQCGDSSLLRQQLVMGSLADAVIVHQEIRAVLSDLDAVGLVSDTTTHLHRQLTANDRALLRLLGASGFLKGGPGEAAYLSELLADVHAEPGDAHA
jgi:alkylation response protein AidB-like acyl-CoA dehydrogenase